LESRRGGKKSSIDERVTLVPEPRRIIPRAGDRMRLCLVGAMHAYYPRLSILTCGRRFCANSTFPSHVASHAGYGQVAGGRNFRGFCIEPCPCLAWEIKMNMICSVSHIPRENRQNRASGCASSVYRRIHRGVLARTETSWSLPEKCYAHVRRPIMPQYARYAAAINSARVTAVEYRRIRLRTSCLGARHNATALATEATA
jgi:hypothetical protein